jgi:Hemocyanin, copper containing domain/Hemocyanin, ig-like domain
LVEPAAPFWAAQGPIERDYEGSVAVTSDELRRQAADFLTTPSPRNQQERFSAFRPDQLDEALALMAEFMAIAHEKGGDAGLAAVLAAANLQRGRHSPGLVKYALELFVTHDPLGQRLGLIPLEQAKPALIPSAAKLELAARTVTDPESALSFFREDIFANEHHKHWHLVYPSRGIPTRPDDAPRARERQGELFLYMHQQMLARYDAERRALGPGPVQALDDLTAPIVEGYDPHVPGLSARPANARIAPGHDRAVLIREDKAIREAVAAGEFPSSRGHGVKIDIDSLGAALEASISSVAEWSRNGPHNDGHVAIADAHPPGAPSGPMMFTDTAIRDPVFWRWHRHIDNFALQWQEHQAPNGYADAPPVRIRSSATRGPAMESPDIIICFRDRLPTAGTSSDVDGSFGERMFGGPHWDAPATGGAVTSELQTMMVSRVVSLEDNAVQTTHLDHREFVYFLRVENLADHDVDITMRLFIAPAVAVDDRRAWIEMDKFRVSFKPRERRVVCRPAWLSSVIRKPATKPQKSLPRPLSDGDELNYCDCGWPYNLLLPRGTKDGMPFVLLAFATDWALDKVAHDARCGSMSFCGARDRYPDTRPMGYPFDRPFASQDSIIATFDALQNAATRSLLIRWTDD